MLHLPALLLLVQTPPVIFDESAAAFRARKAFSVAIGLDAYLNNTTTVGRFVLDYSPPAKVRLVKLVDGRPNLVFWMDGAKFLAYDPDSNEMTVRKAPLSGPIVNRLANAVGGLEDPVAAQLSPDTMAAFFAPFKKLSGWVQTRKANTISLVRAGKIGGQRTSTELDFSASDKLLTKAVLKGPNSKLQWTFAYRRPAARLAFVPPARAKRVDSLAEHAQIRASDDRTRRIVDATLRAYARLTSLAFTASGDAGSTSNWMDQGSFRASQGRVQWAYVRGVLTIKDVGAKKSYRGPCRPRAILTYLKTLGSPMEPTLQALLIKRNPISGWFLPTMTAVGRGSVTLRSSISDAIELRSRALDITVLVRRSDRLVASVASRTKNDSGVVVSETHRDFSYSSVNRRLPASKFEIPVTNPLPLSRLVK